MLFFYLKKHDYKNSFYLLKFLLTCIFSGSFLQEYFPHLRPEIAISSLDKGEEFYQQCLNYHLSCRMTPEGIHEIGLKEVERIKTEIEKVRKTLREVL